MRPDQHLLRSRIAHERADAGEDLIRDRVLGETDGDPSPGVRPLFWQRKVVGLPALDDRVTGPTPGSHVNLVRRLAFVNRQPVAEPCDRPHRHAVRNQDDRDAESAGRGMQRNPVRVAVTRHHRHLEGPADQQLQVPPVVGDQFHGTQRPEDSVTPGQPSGEPGRPNQIGQRPLADHLERGEQRPLPPFKGDWRPFEVRDEPPQVVHRPALVRPARRDQGTAARRASHACETAHAVDHNERSRRVPESLDQAQQQTQASRLRDDEVHDAGHDRAAVADELPPYAPQQGRPQ